MIFTPQAGTSLRPCLSMYQKIINFARQTFSKCKRWQEYKKGRSPPPVNFKTLYYSSDQHVKNTFIPYTSNGTRFHS